MSKTEAKKASPKAAPAKAAPVPFAAPVTRGHWTHAVELFLVNGRTFTVNVMSNDAKMPTEVLAFVNAWREQKDVWFSPDNNPQFGVRVKDVSLYRYTVQQVGLRAPAQKA